MIKIWNTFRRNDNLYTIKTRINATAASVTSKGSRNEIEYNMEKLLDKFGKDPNKKNEKKLKEYLTDELFKHFIDIIAVNNYTFTMKRFIKTEIEGNDHSGFIFLFEFEGFDEEV